jgi:predicted ATPase
MITGLYVDNFRCLSNFSLKLANISLILGENGAGKSTIFDVILRIQGWLSGEMQIQQAFSDSTMTKWLTSNLQVFRLQLRGPDGNYEYQLEINHERKRGLARVELELLTLEGRDLFRFEKGIVKLFRDDSSAGPEYEFDWSRSALATIVPRENNSKLTWFKEYIRGTVVTSLVPSQMVSESRIEDKYLAFDGKNFTNWYRMISQEHQDRLVVLIKALREAIPGFFILRFSPAGAESKLLQVEFGNENPSEKSIVYSFEELSDGERALMVLYSLLHVCNGSKGTLFIDEPDNYLSLTQLQPWLMELSDICNEKGLQAIIVSHHPEFIDYLGPESGIWLERSPNGPVIVADPPNVQEGTLRLSEVIERGWR